MSQRLGSGLGSLQRTPVAFLLALLLMLPVSASADVVRVEILSRTVVLGGQAFGDAGAYEKLVGRIYFLFDPDNASNAQIVDLSLAPRNADGLVEASTDFMVLQPVETSRRRNVAWIEVSNRGGKASLRYFQAAQPDLDPRTTDHFGDALLMRQGLTLIWIGWQHDVPERPGLLSLRVPGLEGGNSIEGLVRADWTVDEAAETLALGHRGHRPYAVASPTDGPERRPSGGSER